MEGEHPYCGPNKKLEECGYSYDPNLFIAEDIKMKLAGWKDMSIPHSVNFILDIVKEMLVTIKEEGGKVLVHCHAGYGRTGIVIACYLIYETSFTTEEIIKIIREKRPGSIQKKEQYQFCEKFRQCIYIII